MVHHSLTVIGSIDSLYGPVPVDVYRYDTDSCRSCMTCGVHVRNSRLMWRVSARNCPIPSRLLSCATYLPQYIIGRRASPVGRFLL